MQIVKHNKVYFNHFLNQPVVEGDNGTENYYTTGLKIEKPHRE